MLCNSGENNQEKKNDVSGAAILVYLNLDPERDFICE